MKIEEENFLKRPLVFLTTVYRWVLFLILFICVYSNLSAQIVVDESFEAGVVPSTEAEGTSKLDSIDLIGKYVLLNQNSAPDLKYLSDNNTRLYITTKEGANYIAKLLKVNIPGQPFKQGNIALLRVNSASSSGSQVFIDELDLKANLVQTITLDSLYQPSANTSTEEFFLTLSGDKRYISLTEYVKPSSNLYGTSHSTIKRVVSFVRWDGSVRSNVINPDLLPDLSFKPKSVYTSDGVDFWLGYGHLSGDYSGLMYGKTPNNLASEIALTSITKWRKGSGVRQLNINPADGLFYFGTGSSKLNYFSSALIPKDSSIINAPVTIDAQAVSGGKGFCFVNSGSNQYLYVAISNSSISPTLNGILRYKKNNLGRWEENGGYGTSTDNYLAIATQNYVLNNKADLFVIRKTTSNIIGTLTRITDDIAASTMTVLKDSVLIDPMSSKAKIYRGISMVPEVPRVLSIDTLANDQTIKLSNKKVNELKIFPNPVTSSFTLQYPKVALGSRLSIINTSGVVLKTMDLEFRSTQIEINVNDLQPGVYIVKLIDRGEIMSYKLFIKI